MYLNKKIFPLLLIVSAMSGCFGTKTEAEHISQAKASIEKGEINTAIINLKNVLTLNAQNAEGRFLLGKSYLKKGLWVSAEKELELANKYEYNRAELIPLLSKVYYHLGDIKGLEELVEKVDTFTEDVQTVLKTFVAITFIKEDYFDQGLNYLSEVIERDFDSKYTKLSQAWKFGLNKELDKALAVIDKILESDPDFAEAIEYKAYLLFKMQNMVKSAEYFGKFIAIHPQAHELRMMYALALVYAEKYTEAEIQVDLLLRGITNSAKLHEIKAQTRFADKDYNKAKQFAERAIRKNRNLVLAQIIAGVSAYQLKQFELAYSHLNSVSSQLSFNHPAKKLFNELRFQMGYEDELYNELLNTSNELIDVNTLGVSATELFKIGKLKEANELLSKAAEKEPDNSKVLYQQGLFKYYNDDPVATAFFEKAVANNPELESAISMLILDNIKNNNFDKAFEIANRVEKNNPELGFTYKGVIYTRQNKFELAKVAFNKVLKLNPKNAGASFKLGQVYEIESDINSAITQYQNSLDSNIRFPLAVSSLLKIGVKAEYKDQIRSFFEGLTNEKGSEYISHIYLASFYLAQNNLKKAELVLDNAITKIPNDFNLMMFKGKVQANNKNYEAAIVSFDELLELSPNSFNVYVAKASALELSGQIDKAIETQNIALRLMPNSAQAKLGLVNLYIKSQNTSAASNLLKQLAVFSDANSEEIGKLQGKVAFLDKDYKKAAVLLNKAFESSKTDDIALELSISLQKIGRSTDALKMIDNYKASANSISLDLLLKQAELLEEEQPNESLNIYNKILDRSNRHFVVLNNMAMIYLRINKPSNAVKLAKEAYEKVPSSSIVQNTYGLSLLASNDLLKAESYLEKVFVKNKDNENYKVHYAKALSKNNKDKKAKALILSVKQEKLDDYTLVMYKSLIK